ncbi:MAG TPA: hypothetical protein HA254_00080 [Candidatus Diapherotrites archaeon]|uniref:DUF3368 domain-containing protein n=1 Tax=Candidatus Iainarchaeum sp. TaxID=3101447 RepID=A0A7J4IU50_9ARCH|nr:hypothetical protein [Candidatus Diapherotrites archaeon]
MLVIKDSMVLIHLAKITLLETACAYFGRVEIPEKVFSETVTVGKEKGHEDAIIIENAIKSGAIKVRKVKKPELVKKANDFSIYGGEAEALALYWLEEADLLATDDDNVRRKKELLDLKLIGTPAIILKLFNSKKIDSKKAKQSAAKLRKIGWFSSDVTDRILNEVEKNE